MSDVGHSDIIALPFCLLRSYCISSPFSFAGSKEDNDRILFPCFSHTAATAVL